MVEEALGDEQHVWVKQTMWTGFRIDWVYQMDESVAIGKEMEQKRHFCVQITIIPFYIISLSLSFSVSTIFSVSLSLPHCFSLFQPHKPNTDYHHHQLITSLEQRGAVCVRVCQSASYAVYFVGYERHDELQGLLRAVSTAMSPDRPQHHTHTGLAWRTGRKSCNWLTDWLTTDSWPAMGLTKQSQHLSRKNCWILLLTR